MTVKGGMATAQIMFWTVEDSVAEGLADLGFRQVDFNVQ